jgi:hypothetical protein
MTTASLLPIPELFSVKCILCSQPHYDPNDIGTEVFARKQAEVFYLSASNDSVGVVITPLLDEQEANALKMANT